MSNGAEWNTYVDSNPEWTPEVRKNMFGAWLAYKLGNNQTVPGTKIKKLVPWLFGGIDSVAPESVDKLYPRFNKDRTVKTAASFNELTAGASPSDGLAIGSAALPWMAAGVAGAGLAGGVLGGGIGGMIGSVRDTDPGESRGEAAVRSAGTGAATGAGAVLGYGLGGLIGGGLGDGKGSLLGSGIGAGAGAILMYLLAKRKRVSAPTPNFQA